MRGLPAAVAVVAVLAAAWLALRAAEGASAAPIAGHVYTGCAESPDDVNPLTAQSPVARRQVLAYTHEALLAVDPATGELRPSAAERFAVAADGGSCEFTLRAGLRFCDGSEATLDDALFPWELAQAGRLALGFVGDAMARVQAVERLDDRRFRATFRDRHFAAPRIVGESWLVVQKRFFVQRVAERAAPGPAPAAGSTEFAALLAQVRSECGPGTGPYRLDNAPRGAGDWRPRQDLLLRRNDAHWRRAVEPDVWTFAGVRLLFRDQQAATNELFAGALDWFSSPALDDLLRARPALADDYRRVVYDYDALGVYRVVWNCRRGPTADARVRRALGRLFDRDALRAGNEGLGAAAVAHCKPQSPATPPGLQPLAFDPAAARDELRAAGFDAAAGTPLRLVVLAPQGTDVLQRIADLFADACRRAGVELDLRRLDFGAYMQERQRGDWDGAIALQSFKPWGDPWDILHGDGVDNFGGFRDTEADRLADAARREPDAARRDSLWRDLHELAHREQPAALLVHPLASILLHRRIEGASFGRNGIVLERARAR